ncbi:hypothetical protein NA57DRAFT_13079, partial [Rhizodiscina lignyota]
YLVFNVTGNPGLAEYYRPFLLSLRDNLSSDAPSRDVEFDIYCRTLSGFETEKLASKERNGSNGAPDKGVGPPFGLESQIGHTVTALKTLVSDLSGDGKELRIILIGHSVGAYMIMEIISKLRRDMAVDEMERKSDHTFPNVVGGICLFPTVTHLAQSSSGRVLEPLCLIPYFPFLVHCLVKLLTMLLPYAALLYLVQFVTRMPLAAAEITTTFLASPNGVYQALYMARDEIRQITIDKWDSDIWGAAHPACTPRPKLFFYFGEQDHWVANEARDQLIAARAYSGAEGEEWKPRMEIDCKGIPHGFVIRHSEEVASKVAEWI